jgi:hypothetical protein
MSILKKRTDKRNPVDSNVKEENKKYYKMLPKVDSRKYTVTLAESVYKDKYLSELGVIYDVDKKSEKIVFPEDGELIGETEDYSGKNYKFDTNIKCVNVIHLTKDRKVIISSINPYSNIFILYTTTKHDNGYSIQLITALKRFTDNSNISKWIPYKIKNLYLSKITKQVNLKHVDISHLNGLIKTVQLAADTHAYIFNIIMEIEKIYDKFYNGYKPSCTRFKSTSIYKPDSNFKYYMPFSIVMVPNIQIINNLSFIPINIDGKLEERIYYTYHINKNFRLNEIAVCEYKNESINNVRKLYKHHRNPDINRFMLLDILDEKYIFEQNENYICIGYYKPNIETLNESYIFGQLVLTKNKLIEILKKQHDIELDESGKIVQGYLSKNEIRDKLKNYKFSNLLYMNDLYELRGRNKGSVL